MNKSDIVYSHENFSFEDTYREVIEQKIYEKYFEVQNGDVVMDLGSNIGLFPISVENKDFKILYSIEPSDSNFTSIKQNIGHLCERVIFINEGISHRNGLSYIADDLNSGSGVLSDVKNDPVLVTKFSSLLDKLKIEKIDFLKIDCEGGEFFVFTTDNEHIIRNINLVAGELHFANGTDDYVCDGEVIPHSSIVDFLNYIEEIFDVTYTSLDGFDITDSVKDNLDYYSQIMFYGVNKKMKNRFIVEYDNGKGKVTSNSEIAKDIIFKSPSGEVEYSEKSENGMWYITNNKQSYWEIIIGEKIVTVDVDNPYKIIAFE